MRAVVARNAGEAPGNIVGKFCDRARVFVEQNQPVEMLDEQFSDEFGFVDPIAGTLFLHNGRPLFRSFFGFVSVHSFVCARDERLNVVVAVILRVSYAHADGVVVSTRQVYFF